MKYLIFSELNRNYFLFLSYFIITIIKDIVNKYITSSDDIIHSFHRYYIYTLSDFLSIIPFIIIKVRSKGISKNIELPKTETINSNSSKKSSKENSMENPKFTISDTFNTIEYIYSDNTNQNMIKRSKRIFKLSIIISIFDFSAIYLNVTFNIIIQSSNFIIKKTKLNSIILFNIVSKYALSILILKTPFYKHNYLSLAVNLVILIGLIIVDILGIDDNKSYYFVLMKIINVILYSFEDVYAKILLSLDSISPYLYLLYRGILVNILAILYSFVFIFVKIPDEYGEKSCVFTRFWKVYENKLNILLYIILFFIEYLDNLNVFLIIDKFSLIHFAVASITENIGSLLISIISEEIELKEFFIKIALYIILIFAALIYIEFIVLNFCGLQKYTKLFLQKEAKKDTYQTILNNNDTDSISQNSDNDEMINTEMNSFDEFKESNLSQNRDSKDSNIIY